MAAPELSVVCRNCGSEVSPYVTECPYCGTRLRKRAPKLERSGDEIRVREGRREKRRRKGAERRERRTERTPRVEDLTGRPVAAGLALAIPAVLFVILRASNLTIFDLGAIAGPPGEEIWRFAAAPFLYEDAGYLFVCGLAIAIFLPPIERLVGSVAAALLVLSCGALGMLGAVGIEKAFGDELLLAAGGNGIALGMLAAYVAIRDPERRADPEEGYSPVAVGVAAAVLLLLPLVEDWANPWVALVGALVGAICGWLAAVAARRETA